MTNSVKPFRLGLAFHCDMANAAISINKSVTDRDRQTDRIPQHHTEYCNAWRPT